jgi:hypothetical protein
MERKVVMRRKVEASNVKFIPESKVKGIYHTIGWPSNREPEFVRHSSPWETIAENAGAAIDWREELEHFADLIEREAQTS